MRAKQWARCAASCLLVLVLVGMAPAEEPKPLTPEQREQLKERNRLAGEVPKLWEGGKQNEAIASVEKIVAITREVFGPSHPEVVPMLEVLMRLQAAREDFPAARRALQEILDIGIKRYGEKDWRVSDA